MLAAISPYAQFFDLNGDPLDSGSIWIGEAGQNPETNPLPVYWDADGTVPATQPIQTRSGYTIRNGAVATIYVSGAYSITVKNKRGVLVMYLPTTSGGTSSIDFGEFQESVIAPSGASVVGFRQSGSGAIDRTVQDKLRDEVSAADFGATGDGSDQTAAIQAWINYLVNVKKNGYWPPGDYLLTAPILKAQDFYCPSIRGAGAESTRVSFTGATGLKIKGGSGAIAQAVISGIGWTGNGSNVANEVADQGGVQFKDCKYTDMQIAGLVHNESAGAFTELVTWDACDFDGSCHEVLVYKRTLGTDSFNGTGLTGHCTINEAVGETFSKIRIAGDALTSDNIVVYNAPMNVQVWKQTALPFIKNNSIRLVTNYNGTMTFEVFSGLAFKIADGSTNVYFVGSVSELNNLAQAGVLRQCRRFTARADGSVTMLMDPYKTARAIMIAGANIIASPPTVQDETYFVTAIFTSSASPWRLVYLLAVNMGAITKSVTTIAQITAYFAGDLPAPTFSMVGNDVVATQAGWPAATVSVDVSVAQIGLSTVGAF